MGPTEDMSSKTLAPDRFPEARMASNVLKICLVASAGGHMTQLRNVSKAWDEQETVWITTGRMLANSLPRGDRFYAVGECNRQRPLRVLAVLLRCVPIVLREKPDVVISTGAAVGCMVCLLAKLIGAKVVWIDSITNVEHLSLSGRLIRPFADLLLVQWPELAKQYRKAEYAGSVI